MRNARIKAGYYHCMSRTDPGKGREKGLGVEGRAIRQGFKVDAASIAGQCLELDAFVVIGVEGALVPAKVGQSALKEKQMRIFSYERLTAYGINVCKGCGKGGPFTCRKK